MGIWIFCFPAVAALGVVCVRTLLITGVPFTSIFTGIFTKLGFTLRYPFNVESVPFSAALLSTEEKLLRVGKRTLQLIFCPIDQADMAHVVCAWGGPVIVLMAVFALIGSGCFGKRRWRSGKLHRAETCGVRNRKTAGDGRWYFLWILIPLTLANLLSFWQLKQIDGNYYNFYYVLLLLAGCRMASSQVQNENVQTRKDHVQILKRKYAAAGFTSRHLLALALPVLLLDFALCAVSSTSWQVGFSPVSWGNYRGYYPHEELERQTMAENGNSQIWEILAEDETNRVIVIGEHPSRLAFPCNTQSIMMWPVPGEIRIW